MGRAVERPAGRAIGRLNGGDGWGITRLSGAA
jgi:hypothetical protein